jgi:hypothetical protein
MPFRCLSDAADLQNNISHPIYPNPFKEILDEEKPAGEYETQWNASSHPSGVYFLRMQSGQFSETRKLLLMK